MNQFKLIVALVLVTMVAVSLGVAGKTPSLGGPPALTAPATSLLSQGGLVAQGNSEAVARTSGARSTSSMSPMSETSVPVAKIDRTSGLTAGLAGTYHIPGDFSSINAAVAVLNFVGATGDVVFQLDAASYSEACPITFPGTYAGAGTFNITIRPKAGVAATINFASFSSEGKGFAFNKANNVTIDGVNSGGSSLTLQYTGGTFPSGDAFASTIYITGASQNITVKKATIKGNILGTYAAQTAGRAAVFIYGNTADAPNMNNNIKVDSCTVINATFALKALSNALATTSTNVYWTHNKVGGAYGGNVLMGALTEAVFGLHYDNNIINGVEVNDYYWNNVTTEYNYVQTFAAFAGTGGFLFNSGQYSAGHIYQSDAASTVANNQILDVHNLLSGEGGFLTYGLVVRIGGAVAVHDNRITNIINNDSTSPAGQVLGLRISTPKVYHNSVRLTGHIAASMISTCLNQDGGDARNNAFSNEMTGGTSSNTRGMNAPGGTADYNAIYSTGRAVSGFATWVAAQGSDPTHNMNSVNAPVNFSADLHIAGGPSSAENIGLGGLLAAADVDGDVRSLTTPDAGADEFANTGSLLGVDIFSTRSAVPDVNGVPEGVAINPTVTVKNNSNAAAGSFDVHLTITGGSGYDQTVTTGAGIPSRGQVTVTFPSWTPTAGTQAIVAAANFAADVNHANDTLKRNELVTAKVTVASLYTECFDGAVTGWVGTGDFVLATGFTKLGGPFGGSGKSWVTKTTGKYSVARVLNSVISPFFDISAFPGDSVWVSFNHSLLTEPNWDRSIFQYTTDNISWTTLGDTNTADGVNWYNKAVYQWASTDLSNFDTAGATIAGYPWTLAGSNPGWTSNGDVLGADTATGPTGYLFSQLRVRGLTSIQKGFIRFRYLTFSDNSGNSGTVAGNDAAKGDGWAWDCFRLARTPTAFTPGTVSGTRYLDVNGNGVNNAEPADSGKVYLAYFGVPVDSVSTNGAGAYTLGVSTPGTYQVTIKRPGYVITQPAAGSYSINYLGDGSTTTGKDFGVFQGTIAGQKYNDKNNNGTKDGGEVALAGWTIVLHKDSCNGGALQTAVTDVSGNYLFGVAPGTYYLNEVAQAAFRQTAPAGGCWTVVISGASGSPTANVTLKDFGNYKKGILKLEKVLDVNGNGVKDVADVTPLPAGVIGVFDLKKNGSHVQFDTVGNGTSIKNITLDTGSYSETEVFATPGWVHTIGALTQSFVVDTSGSTPGVSYGNFKLITVSGSKYSDLNGNGVRDTLEPGLSGWKINIRGGLFFGGTSAITDSNGNWSIDSVGGAKDTVSEVVQAGWTQTAPAGGSYSFSVISGTNVGGLNFGNFRNVTVSGAKYRDRNANGTRNAGEEGLSGWSLNLTGIGGGSTISDGSGNYSFANVGPGSHILTEIPQAGWIVTQPIGGNYTFSTSSNVNVTGKDFGNFRSNDSSIVYRTLSVAELIAGAQVKPVKRPKPGKPIVMPNVANVLAELFLQNGNAPGVKVGVDTVNAAGKQKGFLLPGKYTDVQQTMWKKGISHNSSIARGYDFDNKSKQMLKRQKSLPATKQDNGLTAEMLALSVNIAMSDLGKALSPGLGELIYDDGNPAHSDLNGKTVRQIKAAGDKLMTNYEFQPLSAYQSLQAVARAIDTAFSGPFDTSTWLSGGPKLVLTGVRPVYLIAYLKANPNAEPRITPIPSSKPVPVPDVYALYQNYPNPFNPTTIIEFDLPSDAFVTLKIYNILGQQIATLYDHELLNAGSNDVEFDGATLPSGIYFYRLVAQSLNDDGISTGQTFKTVKKMMMVK